MTKQRQSPGEREKAADPQRSEGDKAGATKQHRQSSSDKAAATKRRNSSDKVASTMQHRQSSSDKAVATKQQRQSDETAATKQQRQSSSNKAVATKQQRPTQILRQLSVESSSETMKRLEEKKKKKKKKKKRRRRKEKKKKKKKKEKKKNKKQRPWKQRMFCKRDLRKEIPEAFPRSCAIRTSWRAGLVTAGPKYLRASQMTNTDRISGGRQTKDSEGGRPEEGHEEEEERTSK
ncbi:protein FAM133A-like [Macrobrachium rosenbergii]|uniref:protein FAM133A-like n=1 Tax=Macrobrachium rosenbergii TaxID=79674 RepID=UPI0034D3B9AF